MKLTQQSTSETTSTSTNHKTVLNSETPTHTTVIYA